MRHALFALLLTGSLALAADSLEEAFRLVTDGQRLTRQAMDVDDPTALCDQALAKFRAAQKLLEAELAARPGDADLERELANVNAMVFWCQRMKPAVGSGSEAEEEPAPPTPDRSREARAALDVVEALEKAGGVDALVLMMRYFEVAERFLGTEASMKAQRRSLDLQRQLEPVAADAPASDGHVPPQAPPAEEPPPPAQADLATRLARHLGAQVRAVKGGAFELTYDFSDVSQGPHWKQGGGGQWIISNGFLSGAGTGRKKDATWNYLDCNFEGDVTLEFEAEVVGDARGIGACIHATDGEHGYGVMLGELRTTAAKRRTTYGFRTLDFSVPVVVEPGARVRVQLKLKGTELTYKVNGKLVWKGKDPAPRGGGYVRFSTFGRIVIDEVRITGTPAASWLEKLGT